MTLPTADSSLIELLGIDELEPSEQETMLLELGKLIFQGTLVRLLERMDEPTKEDFNTLLDTNPEEEEMMQFLTERVPDAEAAAAETVAELKNDILAVTGSGQD